MRQPCPDSERGFVLVGVVWLLLLGTAIVGLLMLRAHARTQDSEIEGQLVQQRLDRESALETVVADLLIRGGASNWARIPVDNNVQIGDTAIEIRITGEEGRLDLNDGDMSVIDQALQGLGYAPAARTLFEGRLAARRAKGRIQFDPEAASLLASLTASAGPRQNCLDDMFTLDGGRTRPNENRLPAALATALGIASTQRPDALRGGESIRVEIRDRRGARLTTILRVVGNGKHPIEVLRQQSARLCSAI